MPKVVHNRLTVRQVAALAKPGFYGDGQGLYLQVSPGGYKSWVLRYTCNGRRRDMGIGPIHIVSLAEARIEAQEAHKLIRALIDPIDERNKTKAERTQASQIKRVKFEDAAEAWLRFKNHKGGHGKNVRTTLYKYIVPVLGKIPAADITPEHVRDALLDRRSGSALWDLVSGARYLGNLYDIFEYANQLGWRPNPINPADYKRLQILGLKPLEHEPTPHPACPYKLIPEFWKRLSYRTDMTSMCLRWAVLNAARSAEARELRWDYIDVANASVVIPKLKMKGKREHRIPYSTASKELLDTMRAVRVGDLVFPSGDTDRPLSENVLALLAKKLLPEIKVTAHGFRNSFTDWIKEATDFEDDLVEIQLAHTIGTPTQRAYRRGNQLAKRREMMNTWAEYCQTGRIDSQYRSKYVAAAD
jgi:integrase